MSRREWTPANTRHVSDLRAAADAWDTSSAEELATFEVEQLDGAVVVHAAGEVDMLTTPRLRAMLRDLIQAGPRAIVLDLEAITFFASSGLAALVEAREMAAVGGVSLRLAALSPSVRRPLQITGLAGRFDCYQDVPTALAD